MVKDTLGHLILLQWIPQDSSGLLLGRCDETFRLSLSAASRA